MSIAKKYNEIDRIIGARVRTARVAAKVSQEKLAEGIGVTFQQVQKYERGTNRISTSALVRISAILNVPITMFIEGLGSGDTESIAADALQNVSRMTQSGAVELLDTYNSLTPTGRTALLNVSRNMERSA